MKSFCGLIQIALLLSVLSSCTKEEAEIVDLDEMAMEEDILEQTPGADPFYTPQEIVIKEIPEAQSADAQR